MTVSMDDLVALCKRRGFIFPASEIYGGINGFWDYGPLGVELKNNIRDAWWQDMVRCPPIGPDGQPLDMVGARHRDHPEPEGVGGLGPRRRVQRPDGRLPRDARRATAPTTCTVLRATRATPALPLFAVRARASRRRAQKKRRQAAQGASARGVRRARRCRRRCRSSSTRSVVGPDAKQGRHAHRAAPVQPDVQDLRRRGAGRGHRRPTCAPRPRRASSSTSRTSSTRRA